MPRRLFRRRTVNRDKYSVEQSLIKTPVLTAWPIVPATDITDEFREYAIQVLPPMSDQGMRKIKHLTITLSNQNEGDAAQAPLVYALVYVPEGYEAQHIRYPKHGYAVNMYDANQFVMSTGVVDFTGGPCRIKTPLSRNLNSGDSIYLILGTIIREGATSYTAQVTYAVTYQ